MSDLSVFFAQNSAPETTEQVVVSSRFKGKDGQPVAWTIRTITEAENDEIRRSATKRVKTKNGAFMPELDHTDYMVKMVVNCVVFPDLKNAELQKSYGVLGAESLIRKMLLPGEYAELLQKVTELNGFDRSMQDLVDEVKN